MADHLVTDAYFRKVRILCTRETQNSIKDSVYRLLVDRIYALGLQDGFEIQKEVITSKAGAEFLFKGLRHNISEIKSLEGVDVCWIEEAEKVSEDSWTILIPTIRKQDSRFVLTWNPEDEESATYRRFVLNPPPSCLSAHLTHRDNAFFPDTLRAEMEYDRETDPEKHEYVWEGKPKRYAQAMIFRGKMVVEEFDPPTPEDQLYFGGDFGFSVDPTCFNRMFIRDRELFIDYEAYGYGVEIEDLPDFISKIPGIKGKGWRIRADSARPDTISHLSHKGYDIVGAEKGADSLKDGIEFLRSFRRIVIHPRCPNSAKDWKNYRWKTDKITREILPIPLDKDNHSPDCTRYALEPHIKKKPTIFEVLGASQ